MSTKLKENLSQLLSDQGSDSSRAFIGRLPVTKKVGLETEKVYTVVSTVHVTHSHSLKLNRERVVQFAGNSTFQSSLNGALVRFFLFFPARHFLRFSDVYRVCCVPKIPLRTIYCCGHWFFVSPFFTLITTGAFFCPFTVSVEVFPHSE